MDQMPLPFLAPSKEEKKMMTLAERLTPTVPSGTKAVMIAEDAERVIMGSNDYLILTGPNKGDRLEVNYGSSRLQLSEVARKRDTVAAAYRAAFPREKDTTIYLIDFNSRMSRVVDLRSSLVNFSTYLHQNTIGQVKDAIWFQMPIVTTHGSRDEDDGSTDQQAIIEIRPESVLLHILSVNMKTWSRDKRAVYVSAMEQWNTEKIGDRGFHAFAKDALKKSMPRWRLMRYFLTYINPRLVYPVVFGIRRRFGLISLNGMTKKGFDTIVQAAIDFAIPSISDPAIGQSVSLMLETQRGSLPADLIMAFAGSPRKKPQLNGLRWFLRLIAKVADPVGFGGDRSMDGADVGISAEKLWQLEAWLSEPAKYWMELEIDQSFHRTVEAGSILKDWLAMAAISRAEREQALRFLEDPAADILSRI